MHLNHIQLGPHRLLNCFSLGRWMRAMDALLGDMHRELRVYITLSWFHELAPEIPAWLSMTSFLEGLDQVPSPFGHHLFIWLLVVASTCRPSSLTLDPRVCFKPAIMGRETISTWKLILIDFKGITPHQGVLLSFPPLLIPDTILWMDWVMLERSFYSLSYK